MAKDIMQLKLQKTILEERLRQVDMGASKCANILQAKKTQRTKISNIDSIPIDELTLTRKGVPISTLRLPKLSVKARPNGGGGGANKENIEPEVMTNSKLKEIKDVHLRKTLGNSEVTKLKKEGELEEERLKKKQKQPKQYPKCNIPESMFPRRYERGELPCTIEHGISGKYLSWACPLDNLDYEYYLPIFFDGLQIKTEPVCFLARQGIEDMLTAAKSCNPAKVIATVRDIMRPLRNALSKYDPALKAIQQLALCNGKIGEALLPYCKQFIGPMSMFLEDNRNLGDMIDYGSANDVDPENFWFSIVFPCLSPTRSS